MLKKRLKQLLSRKSQAQGMVEFALVIPLVLLVVLGIIEFGFFFFVYSSVNSAAREGVRYGAGAGPSAIGVPYYQDCQGVRDAVKRVGVYSGLTDDQIHIGYDSGPNTNQDWTLCLPGTVSSNVNSGLGDRLLVRVTVTYNPIVSMLGVPPIAVEAESARTIVRELEIAGTPLTSPTPEGGNPPTPTEEGADTPTPTNTLLYTLTHTSTPTTTSTPTPTATACQNKNKCDPTPGVCLTPIELGGCE